MEPGVGAQLRVERRHEHGALAAEDGVAVDGGEHLDVGADALDVGRPDEDGVDVLDVVADRHVEVGLEGVHLVDHRREIGLRLEVGPEALLPVDDVGVPVRPADERDGVRDAAAVAEHGPFDVLVNSAGLARHGPAKDTTAADFDAAAALNIRGAYFLTQAVATGLIAAGKPGSLINVSSQMGHVGGVDRAVYCATKHAVEGFTKAMAIEWGRHGIRVNTICPTFIRTALTESTFADPERRRWLEEKIKLGRVGRVEDIMGAVAYLASDAAALVTGTALMVDGGWTAD